MNAQEIIKIKNQFLNKEISYANASLQLILLGLKPEEIILILEQ